MKLSAHNFILGAALSVACFVASVSTAFAQALPSHSFGQSLQQLVAEKAGKLGFADNDPRIAATERAMTAEAEELAAAVGAGVSWAMVGIQGGIAALLGGVPHALGDGSVDQWKVNADGTITLSGNSQASGGPVTSPYPVLSSGVKTYWSECRQVSDGCVYGTTPEAAIEAYVQAMTTNPAVAVWTLKGCSPSVDGIAQCTVLIADISAGTTSPAPTKAFDVGNGSNAYIGPTCATGMSANGACVDYAPPKVPASGIATVTESVAKAIAAVPSSDNGLPLDPSWLAGAADTLWQDAAAAPGYQGLPYPVSDPVTAPDASALQSASPSTYPNVGDFVGPATAPSGSPTGTSPYSVPTSDPSQAAQPTPTNPGSGAEVNLGPDPGIGSPGLEATPTAQSILQPLLSILPSFKSFAVPAHSGTCPQPSFTVFDQSFTVSEHCTLFEKYRSAISGASLLGFAIAALFIVLTA